MDLEGVEAAMSAGNYAEAYCQLRPLADSGVANAQYLLGWMYHNGYGLAIDDTKAERWWQRAAEQGFPDAQFALGQLYDLEDANKKTPAPALDFYIMAARQGHPDAQQILRVKLAHEPEARMEPLRARLKEEPSLFGPPSYVAGDKVNVRFGPGKTHRVRVTLNKYTAVIPLEHAGVWVKVGVAGTQTIGWIHESLVREPES